MQTKTIPPLNKERLQDVVRFINEHNSYNKYNWKVLYAKLQEEILIESNRLSDRGENLYLNNLLQTMEKQVNEYLHAPQPGKAKVFRYFVEHFLQDVREALWQ